MKHLLFTLIAILTMSLAVAQDKAEPKENIMCQTNTCYKVSSEDFIMQTWRDVYNALYAKVPGIRIFNVQPWEVPTFRIRNQEQHVVYIDGVRTTMASLQSLNPADIESITVLPNAVAIPPVYNN